MQSSIDPRRALVFQNQFSPFGNKLVQSGLVSPEQMQAALVESRRSGRALPRILEEQTGQILPVELQQQYRRQQLFELKILYGVESLDATPERVSAASLQPLIAQYLPIETCRRFRVLPLALRESPPLLEVGMVEPANLEALDELNRLLRPKGLAFQRLVITLEDYERLMAGFLDRQMADQQQQSTARLVDVADELSNLDDIGLEVAADEIDDLGQALEDAETAPIVSLANKILLKALTEGASDIHIEPQETGLRVRLRKDGVLHAVFEGLPKAAIPALISRFKIMADLDIAERRLPQDGRIRRLFEGRKIDFRVNSLPSRYGEKIVMRLLDNSATQLGLDKLITDPDTLELVRDMASRPFGLILVTGPTGSGKSTSLYSMLAERNDPGLNISTAEDPIEYTLPGITQVQVIREKGMDFASILRAFMRQDPDVILVGETRDLETAKTAIEAALTGHLVLTTLHANDAPSSIARLDEMGVEPFMVAASLLGVCAQRLVRKVCGHCRQPYHPSAEELARYGLVAADPGSLTFYHANTVPPEQIEAVKAAGQLCPQCQGKGYRGRLGVYEVMRMTEDLQAAVNRGATTDQIKAIACEGGMKTLLAYSLDLVCQGLTTLEEVDRVTFSDAGLEAELKARRKVGLICSHCGAGLQPEWLDCPYCLTPRFSG